MRRLCTVAAALLFANCGPSTSKGNAPLAPALEPAPPDNSVQYGPAPPTGPAAESSVGPAGNSDIESVALAAPPAPEPIDKALDCQKPDIFGPAHSRQKVFYTRYGTKAQHYSQVPTTTASPLESCGLPAALYTLFDLRCDSGKRAFENQDAAHSSRRGSVGPGGRCSSILDLYEVGCPEASYEVHVDMYFCGP